LVPVGEGVDFGDVAAQELVDGRTPLGEHLDAGAHPIERVRGLGVVHGWVVGWP